MGCCVGDWECLIPPSTHCDAVTTVGYYDALAKVGLTALVKQLRRCAGVRVAML